jgi:hypothetical protein
MKKLVYLLPAVAALNSFSVSIGGLNAKLDQLLIVIIAGIFIAHRLVVPRGIYVDRGGFLLLIFFVLSTLASALNAPEPGYSLVQTTNMFTVSLIYFILPNVLRSYEEMFTFIKVQFWVVLICVVISTFLFLFSYSTKIPVFGINLMQNEQEPFGVYFTMLEPNIFGSFMVPIFSMAFPFYMSNSKPPGIDFAMVRKVMYLSIVGIFISFTRGVWLGTLVTVLLYYVINSKNLAKTLYQIFGFFIGVIALIYIAGNVLDIWFVKYKLTNFFSGSGGTGLSRLNIWKQALDSWLQHGHLFLGSGTFSYASYFNVGAYDPRQNAWIGNMVLAVLHDTGLIGLTVFLIFYADLALTGLQTARFKSLAQFKMLNNVGAGLLMGLVSLFIAFFFTTGLTFSYPWILFGLISTFKRLNNRELALQRQADNAKFPTNEGRL